MGLEDIFGLSGKVAVVTGGHSGIGRWIADGLAEAGADIVICARRFEHCQKACAEIEKQSGVKCMPFRCDISNADEVNELIKATINEFETVDILVNNAAIKGPEKLLVEMSDEDWDTTIDINLKGAFLCSRAAAREMMKRNEGKIINISSLLTFMAMRRMSGYTASKGGIAQLTRVMALEMARYNIQVNAISPGYFRTPVNADFVDTEQGKEVATTKIPMQRFGTEHELKGIAIYLASAASSFTTGATMVVDGGHAL
jgi:NAD(P)-dependent dehydrogenase (short-subunit alcohol dehydrogenase family)